MADQQQGPLEPPQMPARGAQPPFIIDQRPGPGKTVRVTWALPGLRRMVVTVPWVAWCEGHHLAVGPAAAELMRSVLPDQMPDPDDDDQ